MSLTKENWKKNLRPYCKKSNIKALWQITNTLGAYFFLWIICYIIGPINTSYHTNIILIIIMGLFLLRSFSLMHDCGHNSLFSSKKLNQSFGLILGVISGIPQYVWSKHHAYHHATNGDWESYKGPLNIKTINDFHQMKSNEKKKYLLLRHPLLYLSIGGFLYFLLMPRYTWIRGNINLLKSYFIKLINNKDLNFNKEICEHKTQFWATPKEYFHMNWNNFLLILYWALMSKWIGAKIFLKIYIPSLSLAGGCSIFLFAIQHNFENSYASKTQNWDYVKGAIYGTSFLNLGRVFNWFTADIAYHHVHHLSSNIPNYNLAKAHKKFQEHFILVKRLTWSEIFHSFQYNLWDIEHEKLTSTTDIQKKVFTQRNTLS